MKKVEYVNWSNGLVLTATVQSGKGYEQAREEGAWSRRPMMVAWPARKQVSVDLYTTGLVLTQAGREAIRAMFKRMVKRTGIKKSSVGISPSTVRFNGLPTDEVSTQLATILAHSGHLARYGQPGADWTHPTRM